MTVSPQPARCLRWTMAIVLGCAAVAGCGQVSDSENATAEPSETAPLTSSPSRSAPPSSAPTSTAPAGAMPLPTGEPGEPRTIAGGLDSPWGLAFLPDGRALVTSRDEGTVQVISPDGTISAVQASGPRGAIPGVAHGGEGGLLGIAVPPGYRDGDDIVAYRTTARGNEVIRASLTADRLGEPRVILGSIPAAGNHNGGRLAFGPDGYLYVTTGDAGDRAAAQDPASLSGKILRITLDGEPAPGNPNPASPVWSLGHRNVQGIGWDQAGRMFASEFGQNKVDELNLIVKGGNYGWPDVEGKGGTARGFIDPLVTWPTSQASPSGLAVTADAVYLAALRGARLWRVPIADGKAGAPRAFLTEEFGRLRTVVVGPDGALWVVTNNTDGRGRPGQNDDQVLRIALT